MVTAILTAIISWFLIIVGLLLINRFKFVKEVLIEVSSSPALYFIVAMVTMIFGLAMVITHNLWVMDWHLVTTIISWIILLSAIFRLFFPEHGIKLTKCFAESANAHYIVGAIFIVIGAFLVFKTYASFV